MVEEEAEEMEEGASTSEVESGLKRTEKMEGEKGKRDSESEEESVTCEGRKRQKAEKVMDWEE